MATRLFLLAALLLLSACTDANSHSAAKAALPANWPFPELSLPADALQEYAIPPFQRELRDSDKVFTVEAGPCQKQGYVLWAVGFDSAQDPEALFAGYDAALRASGYKLIDSQEQRALLGASSSWYKYESADATKQVLVSYFKQTAMGRRPTYDGFVIGGIVKKADGAGK